MHLKLEKTLLIGGSHEGNPDMARNKAISLQPFPLGWTLRRSPDIPPPRTCVVCNSCANDRSPTVHSLTRSRNHFFILAEVLEKC